VADQLNWFEIAGLTFGGLALFLFGLELLTDGLKAIAGPSLPAMLGRMTSNRFKGAFAGAAITALLNSSTITTVLLVGFVSAGLMTLQQSVPMIMGANIGSTFTAQIIAFDLSASTPFLLAIGFLGRAFGRREVLRHTGSILLGLGLLFLGIEFMGDATQPLRTFQPFIDAMQDMKNPILGILIGAFFTAIVQSSAATLGIIIALAGEGLMPLEAGVALILGANVGTCGTALLASIGKSAEAARVGFVHLLFNVSGVLFFVFFIPQLADFVRTISPTAPELEGLARLAAETPRQVANTHTVFSVVSTLILIWFATPLAKLAEFVIPARRGDAAEAGDARYLDEASLTAPSLAIHKLHLEAERAGSLVLDMVRRGAPLAIRGSQAEIEALQRDGTQIGRLASAMLRYIGRLSEVEHTDEESRELVRLTETVNDLESISAVVATNMIATGQQRLAERVDLESLRDESTAAFAGFVTSQLEKTIATVGDPGRGEAPLADGASEQLERLAAAARKSVLERLRLSDESAVLSFRLANDLIEQFKQIGRLSARIAVRA
jgi:phosphate:Na+ symporter